MIEYREKVEKVNKSITVNNLDFKSVTNMRKVTKLMELNFDIHMYYGIVTVAYALVALFTLLTLFIVDALTT